MSESLLVKEIRQNPVVKVTGDNLDIYVRTQHQSSDRQHKDLHMFTSNIIFSRLPHYFRDEDVSSRRPVDVNSVAPEDLMLSPTERSHLLKCYSVLLGRILSRNCTAFKWMESILPNHMAHSFSEVMSKPSKVFPLPIMLKNEAKYEECIDILDGYEDQLINLFTKAHGKYLLFF